MASLVGRWEVKSQVGRAAATAKATAKLDIFQDPPHDHRCGANITATMTAGLVVVAVLEALEAAVWIVKGVEAVAITTVATVVTVTAARTAVTAVVKIAA